MSGWGKVKGGLLGDEKCVRRGEQFARKSFIVLINKFDVKYCSNDMFTCKCVTLFAKKSE